MHYGVPIAGKGVEWDMVCTIREFAQRLPSHFCLIQFNHEKRIVAKGIGVSLRVGGDTGITVTLLRMNAKVIDRCLPRLLDLVDNRDDVLEKLQEVLRDSRLVFFIRCLSQLVHKSSHINFLRRYRDNVVRLSRAQRLKKDPLERATRVVEYAAKTKGMGNRFGRLKRFVYIIKCVFFCWED